MPSVVLVVAGRLDARTGGSIYNRRMGGALAGLGWQVDIRELAGDFPFPSAAARAAAAREFASIPDGSVVLADGLASSVLPDILEHHRTRLRILTLVHLPVAAAVGLDEPSAARLASDERRAIAAAAGVIVTGPGAIPLLQPYGLDEHDVDTFEPGVDPAPAAHGSTDGRLRLLSVGTVTAGKGHDVLLHALASCAARPGMPAWHLTCAGSLTRDPAFASRVGRLAGELGLSERVSFTGELDDFQLAPVWDCSDLFVLASHRETYGMAAAEALARGLPVVGTATGALPRLLRTGAGLVARPGDIDDLTDRLTCAMSDHLARSAMRRTAGRVGPTLPTWTDSARRMAAIIGKQ